jgi:cyclopropane-fatty-acyl-phospholipid synthase
MKEGKLRTATLPVLSAQGSAEGATSPRAIVSSVLRPLLIRLQARLGAPPLSVVLWNGLELALSPEPPIARLVIKRCSTLAKIALDPAFQIPEAYRLGELEVDGDLVASLDAVFRRWPNRANDGRWSLRSALRGSSRDDVQHHYDIGNDFYQLWLDREMLYTCAYYDPPETSLDDAQVAKMDYVCRKLRLRPGERVFEAGCGWGALARHMARQYGVRVTACNVSHEQVRYARECAKREGLAGRVEYVEDDYQNIHGGYDAFVSVGMLEHVGKGHYRALGEVIDRSLDREHGRGLLHFIGRDRKSALNPWIRRHIFPGAYPPTLSEVMQEVLEPWSFSVTDVENLRRHYERTLQHWLERFEATRDAVETMFDRSFVRAWRFYLASSQVAFRTGYLQLFQLVFQRPRDNDVPWSRAGLYLVAEPPSGAV